MPYLWWLFRLANSLQNGCGQIWRLPAEVYSRLESVKLSDNLSFDEVIQILLDNEYRQTTMIAAPGDFKLEDDTIVLLRRAFPYPDKPEPQRVLRLRFTDNNFLVLKT